MRKIAILNIAVSLGLFLASQVLAQAPIKGWDKAKFGMSPTELREAYKEEEEYFNQLVAEGYFDEEEKKLWDGIRLFLILYPEISLKELKQIFETLETIPTAEKKTNTLKPKSAIIRKTYKSY